jgi:hypothetical protein
MRYTTEDIYSAITWIEGEAADIRTSFFSQENAAALWDMIAQMLRDYAETEVAQDR